MLLNVYIVCLQLPFAYFSYLENFIKIFYLEHSYHYSHYLFILVCMNIRYIKVIIDNFQSNICKFYCYGV